MTALIYGGSASGKSQFAEKLICELSTAKNLIYIATMEPYGEEAHRRIEKHRRQRAALGFSTVECYRDLVNLELPEDSDVLLECVGNLMANSMFSPEGDINRGCESSVFKGLTMLAEKSKNLVIVSNDVNCGGSDYDEGSVFYIEAMGRVNTSLSAICDQVAEVVCGIPIYHKGGKVQCIFLNR